MPMNYDKAFALLAERGITTYQIRKQKIVAENALTSMRQGKSVSIETICRLCEALDCQPGDLMEYVKPEKG